MMVVLSIFHNSIPVGFDGNHRHFLGKTTQDGQMMVVV
jgi:hypothetical protein